MKTSNPHNSGIPILETPQIVDTTNAKASGKAKARYPHKQIPITTTASGNMGSLKAKNRAYTPGGPTGS